MPNWIHDEDGLIQAADQRLLTNPCECAVAYADIVGIAHPVPPAQATIPLAGWIRATATLVSESLGRWFCLYD